MLSKWNKISLERSLLGSLRGLEHVAETVLLQNSSSVGSELLSGDLNWLLLLGGDSSLDKLEHLLLKWWESGNFLNNLSNHLGSLGELSLSEGRSGLPGHLGWLGNLESVVHSDENSGSVVGSTHVCYKKATSK